MDSRVGGKYRLERRIGSGSFGNVFIGTALTHALGTNLKTHEQVAIKLVLPTLTL